MDISIYLAKVLGAYMLIVGVAVLIKGKSLSKIIKELTHGQVIQYLGGLLCLIIGLLIVSVHNIWETSPFYVLLITLIGWITVIKGAVHLLLPDKTVDKMIKFFDNRTWFVLWGVVSVIIGVYFLYAWYSTAM